MNGMAAGRFRSMRPTSFSDRLSPYSEKAREFLFGTDTRKGVSVSVFAHVAVAGLVAASFVDWRLPDPPPEIEERPLVTFDISGPETDSLESSNIPELAPPTAVEESTGPVSDAEVAGVAFAEGGSGSDIYVYTPPPPNEGTPEGEVSEAVEGVERDNRPSPAFELIDMPESGSEPTLVSYDVGKFDGAKALQEAARLQGEGRMKMKLVIDEQGIPIGCSTVETSGSNVLDDLGCGLVMTYRYDPGKDAEERPVQSMAYEVLEWSRASALDPEAERIRRAPWTASDIEDATDSGASSL